MINQIDFAHFLEKNKGNIFNLWGNQPFIASEESKSDIILKQAYSIFDLILNKLKNNCISCTEDIKKVTKHFVSNQFNAKLDLTDYLHNFTLLKTTLHEYIDNQYKNEYIWKNSVDYIFLNYIHFFITHHLELQKSTILHHDFSEIHKDRLTLLGQMTSSFVHEFRNPLTSIKGFVQLLKADHPELPYLDIILSELEQLNARISQFLLVSKKDGIHSLPNSFKISELINEIITFIYPSIVDNNTSVEVNIETNFTINGYREEIRQVLLNIILNAVDVLASQTNSRITIYGHQEVNYNILEIVNNGPEIKKDILDNIFKPFITTKESGTGLGLFISKEIIEKHNGTITCSSSKESTNFTIILPNVE